MTMKNGRSWYVMFINSAGKMVGLLGPYPNQDSAKDAQIVWDALAKFIVVDLQIDSPHLRIPAFWHSTRVIDLSLQELERLHSN